MKQASILFLVLILTIPLLAADSVYRLSPSTDLPLAATAIGLYGSSLLADGDPETQHPKESINPLDRRLVLPYFPELDDVGTVLSCTALVLPGIAALAGPAAPGRLATYAVMYAEAFLLTSGLKDLAKAGVSRWRPYTYEPGFEPGEDDDFYNSFPSGHTAYAFMGASFLSTTLKHEFPERRWRIPVTVAAWGLAAGTGTLRVASGEHFISDVAAGALLGSAIGWAVPRLHEERAEGPRTAAILPTGTGLVFSLRF